MKKWMLFSCIWILCLFLPGMSAAAQGSDTIKKGIFADGIDLSGMNAAEAEQAILAYVEQLGNTEITLTAAGNKKVVVTAGDLGIAWSNPDLVTDALGVGIRGNVIERYKKLKDLEKENLVYPIQLSFDLKAISNVLTEKCVLYDVAAVDYDLVRENNKFRIVEGREGQALDVEASSNTVKQYLTEGWNRQACTIALDLIVKKPKGSVEELSQVKDILGSCTTSFKSSDYNRGANVRNGCKLINGSLVYPGEEFSMHDKVVPFTSANGYYPAGSYVNGRVVDSLGGGICQVSTTLYDAVLLAELDVTERYNHSMVVTYVEPAMDAAISESAKKDFKFVNNLDYPIYVEGIIENEEITFNIYGKETRNPNREVRYESKILEVYNPPADIINADASQPIGYVVTNASPFIGYRAEMWKVVLENGKEVSRTRVNTSSYKMVPRNATVGVATENPQHYEEMMAAIGTGNLQHVRDVIAILTAPVEDDEDDE